MEENYRVCIIGCGSIGLHLAARLCLGRKATVVAIARGHTFASLKQRISVQSQDLSFKETFSFDHVSDNASEIKMKGLDAIVVAVKSTQLAGTTETLSTLLEGADAKLPVFFALNGIPWYYFHCHGDAREGEQLPLLDPHGRLWEVVGPERAVHVVCNTACSVPSLGTLQINSPKSQFCICEPSGELSPRCVRLAEALRAGGVDACLSGNMRKEVWVKLLGNICFNPTSVLTDGTVASMATHPQLRESILKPLINEAVCVAQSMGIDTSEFPSADERIEKVRANQHPPSMLQDFRVGRPLEIDSILGQVHAFGKSLGVATPTLTIVMTLVQAATDFQSKILEHGGHSQESNCKRQRC